MDETQLHQGKYEIKKTICKINATTKTLTEFYDVSEEFLEKLTVKVLPELGKAEYNYAKNLVRFKVFNHQNATSKDPSIAALDEHFCDFKSGCIRFVGMAGSGKTTLLKAIAQYTLDKRLVSLSDVEVVFYIDCQTLPTETEMSLEEIIFNGTHLTTYEREKIFLLIRKNQLKPLFVIDSADKICELDQFQKLGEKEKAKPERVMSLLINGHFFSKASSRIITSDRNIMLTPRPETRQKIIALLGLTPFSILQISKGYLGDEEGKKFMEEIKRQSRALLSLCTIPVFLTYTLMGRKSNKNFRPSKMSGVIAMVLNNFVRSPHTRSKNIDEILSKLKKLCLDGMETGKAVFSPQDLKKFKLEEYNDSDFTILRGLVHPSLMQQRQLQFNHLSIQEMLAAVCIVEKNIPDFKKSVRSMFAHPRFTILLRLVFGLMFDDDVFSAAQGIMQALKDTDKKKNFLKNLVLSKLDANKGCLKDLTLICALHEAGDSLTGLLQGRIKSVEIENTMFPLSLNDAFLIGSVAATCRSLQTLSVSNTGLLPGSVPQELYQTIKNGNPCVEITTIKARQNIELAEGMQEFGKLASIANSKFIDLFGCNPTPQGIEKFQQSLGDHEVDKVDLSISNVFSFEMRKEDESKQTLVHITLLPSVYRSNDLTEAQLADFQKGFVMGPMQIQVPVNVNGTWKLVTEGVFNALLKLLPRVNKELVLHGWKFTREQRSRLLSRVPVGLSVSFSLDDCISAKPDRKKHEKKTRKVTAKHVRTLLKPLPGQLKSGPTSCGSETEVQEVKFIEKKKTKQDCDNVKPIATTSSQIPSVCLTSLNGYEDKQLKSTRGDESLKEHDKNKFLLENIASLNDLSSFLEFCKENRGILWDAQLAHHTLTLDRAKIISSAIRSSEGLAELEFRDCELCPESLVRFQNLLRGSSFSVSELSVTAEDSITSLIPGICQLLLTCKTRLLSIGESDVSEETLRALKKHLNEKPVETLKSLDFSYNKDMCDFKTLAEILDLCDTSDLRLMNCDIGEDELGKVKNHLKKAKLKSLNLSYNPEMTPNCMEIVANLLDCGSSDFLGISECEISENEMTSLRKTFEKQKTSLKQLDLSYNDNLQERGIMEVGWTVTSCNIAVLNLSGCDLNAELISALRSSLKQHKFSRLDLSDNKSLYSGIQEVAEIVVACSLEHLSISQCMLSGNHINTFVSSLGSAKLKSLDASDVQRAIDVDHVEALSHLIPHVTEELVVCFSNIRDDHKILLQQVLDKNECQDLELVYQYSPKRGKTFDNVGITVSEDNHRMSLRKQKK